MILLTIAHQYCIMLSVAAWSSDEKQLVLRKTTVQPAAALHNKSRWVAAMHDGEIPPLLQCRMVWKLQVCCTLKVMTITQDITLVSVRDNAVWLQMIWLKTCYVLFSWESKKFEVSRKDYGFSLPPWSVQNEFPNSIWMTPKWFRQMVLLASWVHNFPWKKFLAKTMFIPNLGFLFSNKKPFFVDLEIEQYGDIVTKCHFKSK